MEDADYKCSVCGRQGVKLWRPYRDPEPLICARCAEAIQSERQYFETTWQEVDGKYVGIVTGNKLILRRWYVDSKGRIPSYLGPTPEGIPPHEKTDMLLVNPKGIVDKYNMNEIALNPAIPNEEGGFFNPDSVPDEAYKKWREIPTK